MSIMFTIIKEYILYIIKIVKMFYAVAVVVVVVFFCLLTISLH